MSNIWTPSEAVEVYEAVKSKRQQRQSRAFKMGKMAYQCGNNDNPYEPGTKASKEWQKGHESEGARWAQKFGK